MIGVLLLWVITASVVFVLLGAQDRAFDARIKESRRRREELKRKRWEEDHPLKAYSGHDTEVDDSWVVVFARGWLEAGRLIRGELGLETGTYIRQREAPEFDVFAPGPVTESQYLEKEWTVR